MEPKLVKAFEIRCKVGKPIFIGQDGKAGHRQLIAITGGEVIGFALPFNGTVLDGGVDSQVVRPDGRAELSARYGVKLDDGRSFISRMTVSVLLRRNMCKPFFPAALLRQKAITA